MWHGSSTRFLRRGIEEEEEEAEEAEEEEEREGQVKKGLMHVMTWVMRKKEEGGDNAGQ